MKQKLCPNFAVVEPAPSDNPMQTLMVGSSLVDTSRKDIGILVRLMNTSPENIELKVGMKLGYLHEIDDIELIAEH